MFINVRNVSLNRISVQSKCWFLCTVEEDMSSIVKGEGTGEGWRRVIQICGLIGKRT